MTSASGCVEAPLHLETMPLRRVAFGGDRQLDRLGRCGDCGVVPGAFHHPGCARERCPCCSGQLIMCGCRLDEAELVDEGFTVDVDLVLAKLLDEIPPAWRPGPAPSLPLASVITPLRTRHHGELQPLEAVGGARAGDDTVVVAVAALGRHRDAHGRLHLRRPDVVAAVHRAFLLEDHGVRPLDGVPVALAAVLQWESKIGLSGRADPLEALLEPLRAHFGVGEPPANHVCQCFAPHDPWCPPDHRLLPVRSGHLVHARIPDPVDELTAPAALTAFTETWCPERHGAAMSPPALSLLGSFVGSRATGRLWVFGDEERPGRYDALHLDAGGVPYVARPDRRYRTGFRWCEVRPSEVGWLLHRHQERYPTAVA